MSFAVLGTAVPQGSMKAFVQGGKAVVTHRGEKALEDWRHAIATEARGMMTWQSRQPATMTLRVAVVFRRVRPATHFVRGALVQTLKASAPAFWDCAITPDVDKLGRAVLDALSGVAWIDDKQVAGLSLVRQWAGPDVGPSGAVITVRAMDGGLEDLF